MTRRPADERGSAMVLTLAVLAVLTVLGFILLAIALTEKRTAFVDYTNSRSFYSADAASEAAVNWLRHQGSPPPTLDSLNSVRNTAGYTTLHGPNRYDYGVQFVRKHFRPGWSVEYKDYEFLVSAYGASAQASAAEIAVNVLRIYREGYGS